MRRYNEPIEVRQGRVGDEEGPAQFLWRDRLWVIRALETRWLETGAWWEESAEANADLLKEREVWRVVAGRGAKESLGVYELDHSWFSGQWRLRAVMD